MNEIKQLQVEIAQFCDERDWGQFHNLKDLSAAIAIEAAELQECFLWKKPEEAREEKIREELADVFIFALRMAERAHLDVADIVRTKVMYNAKRYPVDKARGNAIKSEELQL